MDLDTIKRLAKNHAGNIVQDLLPTKERTLTPEGIRNTVALEMVKFGKALVDLDGTEPGETVTVGDDEPDVTASEPEAETETKPEPPPAPKPPKKKKPTRRAKG